MLKFIIIIALAIFLLAGIVTLVQRFSALFITLAILAAIGFVVYLYLRKKKGATSPVLEDSKEPEQLKAPEKPTTPESIVNKYEVAGVVFYLKNLLPLMEPNYLWDYKKQDLIDTCNCDIPIYKTTLSECQLRLSAEPDNPHDPNAIMVLLDEQLVGYIAKKDCKHILEIMKTGQLISMTCEVYGGKYKMVVEDYDISRDKSTYSMESGEDEYGITIHIREKVQ